MPKSPAHAENRICYRLRFCRFVNRRLGSSLRKTTATERGGYIEGDTPKPPLDWSIRVGEFAYNLRSALDHLVWQLVEANRCSPDSRTAFPILKKCDVSSIERQDRQLRGVSTQDRQYIVSIQPYQEDFKGIGLLLANLNAIGNIDKHRHIVAPTIRWTGVVPQIYSRRSWSYLGGPRVVIYPSVIDQQPGPTNLRHGQWLLSTRYDLTSDQFFVFQVEAVFEDEDIDGERWGGELSVPEMLDNCITGVELVIGHFKNLYESAVRQDRCSE